MKHEINIHTWATMLTAALLLSGCTRQPDPSLLATAATPAPLQVRVEVAAQSRSVVTGTAFTHGSTIGIVLHDQGATTTYPDGSMMPYRLDQPSQDPGVWLATEPEGLLVSDPADVVAYYPAPLPAEAVLDANKRNIAITLPATLDLGAINTSTDFESVWLTLKAGASPSEIFVSKQEVDLMTGSGTEVSTAAGGTKQTTINMKHALAMVVVYVKRNDKVTEPIDVRQITLRNAAADGPLVQGSFALADNAFTPNATPASYTRTMSGFAIDAARYAMLVYPATMADGAVEMELTTDLNTYTMPMPAKTWASGKVYIYNIEISANEAQIGGVTLADWPAWTEKELILD